MNPLAAEYHLEQIKWALDRCLPLCGGAPVRRADGTVSMTIERVIADEPKTLTVEADYWIEEKAQRAGFDRGGAMIDPAWGAVVSLGVVRDDQGRQHYLTPEEQDDLQEKATIAADKRSY